MNDFNQIRIAYHDFFFLSNIMLAKQSVRYVISEAQPKKMAEQQKNEFWQL